MALALLKTHFPEPLSLFRDFPILFTDVGVRTCTYNAAIGRDSRKGSRVAPFLFYTDAAHRYKHKHSPSLSLSPRSSRKQIFVNLILLAEIGSVGRTDGRNPVIGADWFFRALLLPLPKRERERQWKSPFFDNGRVRGRVIALYSSSPCHH